MKITKVSQHGKIRFRVNNPNGPNGKRQRRFFASAEAARRYASERTADVRAFGIHFSSIAPSDRAAVAYQLQRLRAIHQRREERKRNASAPAPAAIASADDAGCEFDRQGPGWSVLNC